MDTHTPVIPIPDVPPLTRSREQFERMLRIALGINALGAILQAVEGLEAPAPILAGLGELLDLIGDALIDRAAEGLSIAGTETE